MKIKQYVPQALSSVPILTVAENENGSLVGFRGLRIKSLKCYLFSMSTEGREILIRYCI